MYKLVFIYNVMHTASAVCISQWLTGHVLYWKSLFIKRIIAIHYSIDLQNTFKQKRVCQMLRSDRIIWCWFSDIHDSILYQMSLQIQYTNTAFVSWLQSPTRLSNPTFSVGPLDHISVELRPLPIWSHSTAIMLNFQCFSLMDQNFKSPVNPWS